jgi:hypothetical protein
MKKSIFLGAAMILFAALSYAQSFGVIKGRLFDNDTKKSLPGAHVIVKNGNTQIAVESDLNGYYVVKPLNSGEYTVVFSYMGFKTDTMTSVIVNPGKITFLEDLTMSTEGIMIGGKPAEVIGYRDPLIGPDPIKVIRPKELNLMAGHSKLENVIGATCSDIYVSDRDELYFRGARSDNFIYIVDGIKSADGKAHIPSGAIGSLAIYTGGVPAEYGDFTGGCIVIETKSFFDK